MPHTPHDYTDYQNPDFSEFAELERETLLARSRLSARYSGRQQAWALTRDYTDAGGDPQHLIDAINAFMEGEPEPPFGPYTEPDPRPRGLSASQKGPHA